MPPSTCWPTRVHTNVNVPNMKWGKRTRWKHDCDKQIAKRLFRGSTILHSHVIELGLGLTDEIASNEASDIRDEALAEVKSVPLSPLSELS